MVSSTFNFNVAGVQNYELYKVRESLAELSPLQLRRQPDNPHDPNAVEVLFGGHKLGFVNKEAASRLAPLMDTEGMTYKSLVSILDYTQTPYNQIQAVVTIKVPDGVYD